VELNVVGNLNPRYGHVAEVVSKYLNRFMPDYIWGIWCGIASKRQFTNYWTWYTFN